MSAHLPLARSDKEASDVPPYLSETYSWAYLKPLSLAVFDHSLVVSAILWGNAGRLQRAAFAEIRPGQTVLQPACVYGRFSADLARLVGYRGRLEILDVASIQVENCRRKVAGYAHAGVRVADAAKPPGSGPYDVVCCFFLLHELPDDYKRRVVDNLLNCVAPGGKAVFVDYHRPSSLHPLRLPMGLVFDTLEPFAKALWTDEIVSLAAEGNRFTWRKETYFGGLYQKVVAERRGTVEAKGEPA